MSKMNSTQTERPAFFEPSMSPNHHKAVAARFCCAVIAFNFMVTNMAGRELSPIIRNAIGANQIMLQSNEQGEIFSARLWVDTGDSELVEVCKLATLTKLDSCGSKITDHGLLEVKSLQRLAYLNVCNTRVTGKKCDSPGLSDSGGGRIMVPYGGPKDEPDES